MCRGCIAAQDRAHDHVMFRARQFEASRCAKLGAAEREEATTQTYGKLPQCAVVRA